MPPPFSVRSGVSLEKDLGQWDSTGSITIPGNLVVGGSVTASNVAQSEVQSVTAGDATIVVGGTAANPTVKVGTGIAESSVTNLTNDLAAKAPLAAPAFTGSASAVNLTVTGALAGVLNSAATAFSAQTDSGTVTSATYVTVRTGTANVAGVAFVAPPSGQVLVNWSSGISSTAGFAIASIQVLTGAVIGSGTGVVAGSDNNALQTNSAAEVKVADFYLVTGLTPGSSYNTQIVYRVTSAGTATFNRPKILVQGA